MKKTLAILLVVCLMFTSLFSIPVFAEEGTTFLITELEGKYKSQGRNYLNTDGVLLVNYPANGVEFNAYCKGDVYVTFNVANLGYKDGIGGCYFNIRTTINGICSRCLSDFRVWRNDCSGQNLFNFNR